MKGLKLPNFGDAETTSFPAGNGRLLLVGRKVRKTGTAGIRSGRGSAAMLRLSQQGGIHSDIVRLR